MLKITGYILLAISCLSFILIPVIPWFDYTGSQIAGITTVLIIIGEVLFYTSIFILGKTFYEKIKSRLKFWKPKTRDPGPDENKENGIMI